MSGLLRFLNTLWHRYFLLLLIFSAEAVTADRRKRPINDDLGFHSLSVTPLESVQLARWVYHPERNAFQDVLGELKRTLPAERSKWVKSNLLHLTMNNNMGSTFLHDLITYNETELLTDLLPRLPGENMIWLPKVENKNILDHAIDLKKPECVDIIGQTLMRPRYSLKLQHAILPFLINHGSLENFELLVSTGKIPVNLIINYILTDSVEPATTYKMSLLNYILVTPNIPCKDFVKILLKYHVDVNLIPNNALEPQPDWHPVTGNVIALNLNVDANTSLLIESYSPLMLSIGLDDITELLLTNGADPNQANHKGILPVHIIYQNKDILALNLLLKYGLYLNKTQQENALDVAKKEGFHDFIHHMKESDLRIDNHSKAKKSLYFTTFLTTVSTVLLLYRIIFKRFRRPPPQNILIIDQELFEEICPPENSFLTPLKEFTQEALNLPAELDSTTLIVDISSLEKKEQITFATEKLARYSARQYPEQGKEISLNSKQLKNDIQQLINACQGIHCEIKSKELIVHTTNNKRKNTGSIRSLITKLTHACFEGSQEFQADQTKKSALELIEEISTEIQAIRQHYDRIPPTISGMTYSELPDSKINKWVEAIKAKQSSYSNLIATIKIKLEELDKQGLKNQNVRKDLEALSPDEIKTTLKTLAVNKASIQEIREVLSRQFNCLNDLKNAMEELDDKIHRALKEQPSPSKYSKEKQASPRHAIHQESKPAHSRGKEEQEVNCPDAANEASYPAQALTVATETSKPSSKKTNTGEVIIIRNNNFSLFPLVPAAKQSAPKLSAERLQILKESTVLHLSNACHTIASIEELNFSDPFEQTIYRHKLSYDLMHCCLALHNMFIQTGKYRQANIAILLRHMLCHLPQEAQLNELCNLAIDIKYFVDTQFKSSKEMNFNLRFENSELFQELWPKWNDKNYQIPGSEHCTAHISALVSDAAKISADIETVDDIQSLSIYHRDALRMIVASAGEYLKNLKSQHQALWKSFDLRYKGMPMEGVFIKFRNSTFHNLAWNDTGDLFKLALTCVSWMKSRPDLSIETYPGASAEARPSV